MAASTSRSSFVIPGTGSIGMRPGDAVTDKSKVADVSVAVPVDVNDGTSGAKDPGTFSLDITRLLAAERVRDMYKWDTILQKRQANPNLANVANPKWKGEINHHTVFQYS